MKRLLFITQKVDKDDDVLGFVHRWIEEFAKHVERVEVVCLSEGTHAFGGDAEGNVHIHSLGKEKRYSKIRQLWRFWRLCWKLVPQTDGVFVHMNPIYVTLGAPFFKMLHKPIVLWYSHRDVTWLLRIAERLVTKIFSISPAGFRLPSKKVSFVGHGIDTEFFSPRPERVEGPAPGPHKGFAIAAVGRITPIKNFDTLVLAFDRMKDAVPGATVKIVGEAIYPADRAHKAMLQDMVARRGLADRVVFTGHVPYSGMPEVYRESDVAVNLAPHGGTDKTVLEAMACGIPVLVSNAALREDLGIYANRLLFQERNVVDLAKKLTELIATPDRQEMGAYLRSRVMERHNLQRLVPTILSEFSAGLSGLDAVRGGSRGTE